MGGMKFDMSGAAAVLGTMRAIAERKSKVNVVGVMGCAMNMIGESTFVPDSIYKSYKGLFVEIDNTDAEGRLILADALARAAESEPELIIDFATLTGAARTALGPDLPATFANRDDLAAELERAARDVDDPLWRLPLWDPYDDDLKSSIADLANTSGNAMAGAIYAALFLRRFVPRGIPWAHLDTWAWRDPARPGRPRGGEALGLRAVFATLRKKFPPS